MEDQNKQTINDNTPISSASNTENSNGLGRLARIPIKIVLVALGILVVVVILVIVGLSVVKKDDARPKATNLPPKVEIPENVLLATVGDTKIMRDDVVKLALEQTLASGITTDVLKTFLNIAIELEILRSEAVAQKVEIPKFTTQKEEFEYLKNKITEGKIKTVEAYTIAYWIPSDGYPQEPLFDEQRKITPEVIAEAKKLLNQGEDPLVVANSIYDKYPILQSVLAFNGGQMKQAKEKNIPFESAPRVYEFVEAEGTFYLQEKLFAMSDNQIEGYSWPDGSGAAIIKVEKINRGEATNYENWMNEKKKNVQYNQSEIDKLK